MVRAVHAVPRVGSVTTEGSRPCFTCGLLSGAKVVRKPPRREEISQLHPADFTFPARLLQHETRFSLAQEGVGLAQSRRYGALGHAAVTAVFAPDHGAHFVQFSALAAMHVGQQPAHEWLLCVPVVSLPGDGR